MKPRHRPDGTRSDIVDALRDVNAIVIDQDSSVPGIPDLAVLWLGTTTWLEVKSEKGKLRPEQEEFRQRARRVGVRVEVVRTPREALKAIGVFGARADDNRAAMRELSDKRHPGRKATRTLQPSVKSFA